MKVSHLHSVRERLVALDVGDPQLVRAVAAWNRRQDERGRLWGWGMTNPRRDKIRQIVATDGEQPVCWRRCHAMVSAPAS